DYYLGLIHAGAGNVDLAIDYWKEAVAKNSRNVRALRNLGLAHLRSNRGLDQALQFYEQAFTLNSRDSRILMELDSVREALGVDARERLEFLKQHRDVVETRDDLLTAMLDLMVQNGKFQAALDYYRSHHFHNWEGRYDIHIAYMEANIGLAQQTRDPAVALSHYERAAEYPPNLEIAPRDPNLRGFLYYPMALLHKQLGNTEKARELLETTAQENTDPPTLATFYQALALRELGQSEEAEELIGRLRQRGLSVTEDRTDEADSSRALGHYYLALVARFSGNQEAEQRELSQALTLNRGVERAALRRAQVVFANASQ
ncbi:MAG TPA: tetratricopeptide repeat protein, partial [Acidobacteriota bacterium]|nr:tetratricopeptide repeat protein [Acidobacteriota bacterium]